MTYTFYSFKGGVGRSMAVANVAEIMYGRGLKVLLVDFDLEAPGLERYFDVDGAVSSPDEIEGKRGLIDLLVSYNALRQLLRPAALSVDAFAPNVFSVSATDSIGEVDPGRSERLGSEVKSDVNEETTGLPFPVEPLTSFIHQLYAKNGAGGEVYILPAGQRAKEGKMPSSPASSSNEYGLDNEEFARYAERVRAFPWNDFYTKWEGQRFFEWFRKEAQNFADVVLIDSRTGVTEMSGICTYHLADVVVMFTAPNKQNLVGTKMIGDSLIKPRFVKDGRKGRNLSLLFVPSRVDLGEKSELDGFARIFDNTFNTLLPRELTFETSAFVDLKIPYVPFYSFREEVAVRDHRSPVAIEMIRVYEKLCLTLAKLDPPGGKLREKYDPKKIVEGNTAEQQNRFAESSFSELKPEEQEEARPVLFRMVRLAHRGEAVGDTCLRVNIEEFNEKNLRIVRRLSEVGLLTIEKEKATGIHAAQLAQESFIDNWDRLRKWLDKDRAFLLWRQQIKTNIEQWNNSKREKAALLSGVSLADAKRWRERHEPELTDLESLYIVESARRQTAKRIRNLVAVGVGAILLVLFVVVQWRRSQLEEAEKQAAMAEAINTGDTSVDNEDFNSAIKSYNLAIGFDPDNVQALNRRGKAYFRLTKYDEAIGDFNRALELKPDAEAYSNRGLVYTKRNELDEAMADLTKAVQLKPDYAEAYYDRGNVQRLLGKTGAAIDDYDRAIILKNDNYPEAFLARGTIYQNNFDKNRTDNEAKAKAISDLTKAITLTSIPGVRTEAEQRLQLIAGPSQGLEPEPPRVFIHYNDPDDEGVIAPIAGEIRSAHITVIGIQPNDGFTTGDVRYYYPEDKKSAQSVQEIVVRGFKFRKRELDIKLRFLGNYYKDVPRGSIEVWIPSLNGLFSTSGGSKSSTESEPAKAAPRNRNANKR